MRWSALVQYKTVEFDGGIAIIAAADKLQRPDAVDLIVADGATTAEYLRRYIPLREAGKSIRDANADALEGSNIIERGALLVGPR